MAISVLKLYLDKIHFKDIYCPMDVYLSSFHMGREKQCLENAVMGLSNASAFV